MFKMEMKIDRKIMEKYPEVQIGVIVVKNMDNSKAVLEAKGLMREQAHKIETSGLDIEEIQNIPAVAGWREIYADFGAKPPSKFRNSIESLLRRCVGEDSVIPGINPVVDLYNYISLKYTMPVGGDDIDSLVGDLEFTYAKGDEEFKAILSDKGEPPFEGEIVYKDDKGAICRCWNWRGADRTKLEYETKNALLVIENNLAEQSDKFYEAIDELKKLVEEHLGGECTSFVLDKDNLEGEL